MYRLFTQKHQASVGRKCAAVMAVLLLNLAILPCAMALQAPESEHDCCPPKVELQQLECCEVDDVSFDHRDNNKPNVVMATAVDPQAALPTNRAAFRRVAVPAYTCGTSPPIYVLNCVYLK